MTDLSNYQPDNSEFYKREDERNRLAQDGNRQQYISATMFGVLIVSALVLIALAFNEWWEMSRVAEAYR